MSPTAAIVMRSPVTSLTGSGAGASTGGGGAGCSGTSAGCCAAQPARQKNIHIEARLVTEADSQDVDMRVVQAPANGVEFVEISRRADAHAMIGAVVDRDTLDA